MEWKLFQNKLNGENFTFQIKTSGLQEKTDILIFKTKQDMPNMIYAQKCLLPTHPIPTKHQFMAKLSS